MNLITKILSVLLSLSFPLLLLAQQGMTIETGESISYNSGFHSGGFVRTNAPNSLHLLIDNNEIQAIANVFGLATLNLNAFGNRRVIIGDNSFNPNGKVGIGLSNPTAKLHIKEPNSTRNALSFRRFTGVADENWAIGLDGDLNHKDLVLSYNDTPKGYFDFGTGAYHSLSDKRVKKEIAAIPTGALTKIMQLNPTTYHYKSDSKKLKKSIGYIAQEVKEVLPEAVQKSTGKAGHYAVNYQKISVFAVKAIQELQEMATAKEQQIQQMEAQLAQLKTQWDQLENKTENNNQLASENLLIVNSNSNSEPSFIQQNQPNPFQGQTSIAYYISPNSESAQIMVVDKVGRIIFEQLIPQKGHGQMPINFAQQAGGFFYYHLIVDGEKVASKKMILVK